MEHLNTYHHNKLAEELVKIVTDFNFGDGCVIRPVTSPDIVEQIKQTEIRGIDYRAKTEPENGFASVFEGLAFDQEKVRSQSFAIYEQESPVGVMSFVIAPKTWIAEQRYFMRENGGVRVVDAKAVTGTELPNFYIIPAWTKVISTHRLKFAIPGFRAFTRVMTKIQESSPQHTWIESIAQGQFPFDKKEELVELSKRALNTFIPEHELPFNLKLVGKNNPGSSSTVKMAKVMGLNQIDNLGSGLTLGPVFTKKVA